MIVKSSKKVRRRQAAVELVRARKTMEQLGTDSEEALLNYCHDKKQSEHNRLRACGALAQIHGQKIVPFLLRLAKEDDRATADAAMFGLRCIGSRRATRLLIDELRYAITDTRRQAALDAIRFLEDRRAERAVSHVLLTDECANTRELAAEVLSYVHHGRRTTRALIQALSDPSPGVRWWALSTLAGTPDWTGTDMEMIKQHLSDHATVSGVEPPEQGTVADATRNALEAYARAVAHRREREDRQ
jgi:HEAT repeat protein